MKPLTVYTAASFRQLHAVRLFHDVLRARMPDVQIADWTDKATPPDGLTPDERRRWFDTEQQAGQVYEFCADACANADVVVYLGESGGEVIGLCPSLPQGVMGGVASLSGIDAGVEVGLAAGAGTPVLGIRGPLEAPGLMLHGTVNLWCRDIQETVEVLTLLGQCCGGWSRGLECFNCKARPVCNVLVADPWR